MDRKTLQLLDGLVRVRSLLREAEATTTDLPQKLVFSHDESEGWPVLRLRAEVENRSDAPNLRITADDNNRLIIHSSLATDRQVISFNTDEALLELRDAVTSAVERLLDWISAAHESSHSAIDEIYNEEVPSEELFDTHIETSAEPVETLPNVKI